MKNIQKPFLISPVIEMCVLVLLNQEDTYGYNINKNIGLHISESTIYPILKRLESEEYLKSYSQKYNARIRKVYKITVKGKLRLTELINEWDDFVSCIDSFLDDNHICTVEDK